MLKKTLIGRWRFLTATIPKIPPFACSNNAIATYLLKGGLFHARMAYAVPRSEADDLSCDHVPHT
jgi:hypothetical protein